MKRKEFIKQAGVCAVGVMAAGLPLNATAKGDGKVIEIKAVKLYEHGIPAGTAFEDLPADWKCPRCKQGKEKFNRA